MDKTTKHPLAVWREAQTPPLTQEEFAGRIGSTRWTVNSIETGRRRAGHDLARVIIRHTNGALTFEALMAWEPTPAAVETPTPTEQVA